MAALNPQWLETFKVLVEVGHFTQTAEKLYMTQPGVSQHIKKLELACGHELLKREGKSFELTEQGQQVYDYALTQSLRELELLESLSFDDPQSGECRLACSGALALLMYPQLISLQKQYPELTAHIEAAPNHKILDDIQSGSIDLGVVTHIPTPSLFQSKKFASEPLCLILPRQYQDLPITPELLVQLGLVKHPDAEHYLSLYFDLCGDKKLAALNSDSFPVVSYINQIGQILLPISQGIGFTVLPQSAVEMFAERHLLHVHTPPETVLETLYLVQKRNRQLPERYVMIKEVFKQSLQRESEKEEASK